VTALAQSKFYVFDVWLIVVCVHQLGVQVARIGELFYSETNPRRNHFDLHAITDNLGKLASLLPNNLVQFAQSFNHRAQRYERIVFHYFSPFRSVFVCRILRSVKLRASVLSSRCFVAGAIVDIDRSS
jgi:hypothetical protein